VAIVLSVLFWCTTSDYPLDIFKHFLKPIYATFRQLRHITVAYLDDALISVVRVTRSLVLCVCFVDRCLSFCPVSIGHCVFCSSSNYWFWIPLWYLQTLLLVGDDEMKLDILKLLINYLAYRKCRVHSIQERHG
jgi:hypothetical protein